MLDQLAYLYDAAVLAAIGRRDVQEDAMALHFPTGARLGYLVLADGMGGHAAGDVASAIVVQEVFDELQLYLDDPTYLEGNIGAILRYAMERANRQLTRYTTERPDRRGMGATLVAPLIVANRLYWISVGDSPLYLLRGNRLSRLNQEHSQAHRLDRMVRRGLISQTAADQDPDRHCLTSVLLGETVPEIDCRDRPLDLLDGDIVIAASDGLLFLDEARIAALVHDNRDRPSADIAASLLQDLSDRDDPHQDNVSLCVLKVSAQTVQTPQARPVVIPRRPAALKRTTIQVQVRRKGGRVLRTYSSESEG